MIHYFHKFSFMDSFSSVAKIHLKCTFKLVSTFSYLHLLYEKVTFACVCSCTHLSFHHSGPVLHPPCVVPLCRDLRIVAGLSKDGRREGRRGRTPDLQKHRQQTRGELPTHKIVSLNPPHSSKEHAWSFKHAVQDCVIS